HVAVDSGATRGGDHGGADSRGAGSGDAAKPTGGRVMGTLAGDSESGRQLQPSRQETLLPRHLREWAVWWGSPGGGAWGASAGGAGSGGADAGGAGAGGSSAGGAGAGGAGARSARFGGLGGAGARGPGARRQETLSPSQLREWALQGGRPCGGAGAVGAGGAGNIVVGGSRNGAGGPAGPVTGGSGGAPTQQQLCALCHLLSLSPAVIDREPASCPVTRVLIRRAPRARPPPVPNTHTMALRPSSFPQHVVLPLPPASSLPDVPDPESYLAHSDSPTVTRVLATLFTDPSFASTAASALLTELIDFFSASRIDYFKSLVTDSESDCPSSVGGELALGCDVLEDKQFEPECFADVVPHLAAMLLAHEGDPDALDIPTLCSYAEAIICQYFSQWQTAMDAKMAS
ncbi:unnamed protein product, partial [Closterium sp. NIES-54]